MTFGLFQEHISHGDMFKNSASSVGVVGTTTNGVMYLSMPILFTLLERGQWAQYRPQVAYAGIFIASLAFLGSSFAQEIWHLVVLQGVLAALGLAMLYTTTTLQLDECFLERRATAYGAAFSSKNIVGAACPFLMFALLDKLEFRWTMRAWSLITCLTATLGLMVMPRSTSTASLRSRVIPWSFLRHKTFYIYSIGNFLQSVGYAIPQTYLASYAADVLRMPAVTGVLLISLFNLPGIVSAVTFGFLADRPWIPAWLNSLISALGSACFVFAFWAPPVASFTIVIPFAMGYGFFAGGYSSTWAGWIKELEREARENNESVHTGMLYGLLNGVRGVGYAVAGPIGVSLLNAGQVGASRPAGFGTKYGSLILFTGICAVLGGWSAVWKGCHIPAMRGPGVTRA